MEAVREEEVKQRGVGVEFVKEVGFKGCDEPLKFLCAPTLSLERLIVSGAVNLGGRSVW